MLCFVAVRIAQAVLDEGARESFSRAGKGEGREKTQRPATSSVTGAALVRGMWSLVSSTAAGTVGSRSWGWFSKKKKGEDGGPA